VQHPVLVAPVGQQPVPAAHVIDELTRRAEQRGEAPGGGHLPPGDVPRGVAGPAPGDKAERLDDLAVPHRYGPAQRRRLQSGQDEIAGDPPAATGQPLRGTDRSEPGSILGYRHGILGYRVGYIYISAMMESMPELSSVAEERRIVRSVGNSRVIGLPSGWAPDSLPDRAVAVLRLLPDGTIMIAPSRERRA
jgi:hypothetical protein